MLLTWKQLNTVAGVAFGPIQVDTRREVEKAKAGKLTGRMATEGGSNPTPKEKSK